jgi:hypothetical protein
MWWYELNGRAEESSEEHALRKFSILNFPLDTFPELFKIKVSHKI